MWPFSPIQWPFQTEILTFSVKNFDIGKITFSNYPKTVLSVDGIGAKIKLLSGGFVIRKSTPKRMLRDMKLNNISKAVVMQISPPDKNSAYEMNRIVQDNKEFITFDSIHPDDCNPINKVDQYLSMDIKGWKIAPHVCGFNIDSENSVKLLKVLADTGLPILSCSGLGVPESFIKSGFLSKKQKHELTTQRIKSFYSVLRKISHTTLILVHAGIFEIDKMVTLMQTFPNTYTDISK